MRTTQCTQAERKAYEWVFATLKLNGHFMVHEAEVIGDTAWVRTNSTGRFTVSRPSNNPKRPAITYPCRALY